MQHTISDLNQNNYLTTTATNFFFPSKSAKHSLLSPVLPVSALILYRPNLMFPLFSWLPYDIWFSPSLPLSLIAYETALWCCFNWMITYMPQARYNPNIRWFSKLICFYLFILLLAETFSSLDVESVMPLWKQHRFKTSGYCH